MQLQAPGMDQIGSSGEQKLNSRAWINFITDTWHLLQAQLH